MTRDEKITMVDKLADIFSQNEFIYLTDSSALTVAEVNDLRRLCHERNVFFKVVKNTLVKKAFERSGDKYSELYDQLKGPTAIMYSEVSNDPAKLIKEFRKTHEKPQLKAAYINSDIFVGDEQLETLANLKSKEELVAEVLGLLLSPMQTVIGALKSGGGTIAGILKTLSEKEEN